MREFITNLALFIVFCVAFSAFTACSGTQADNANSAKKSSSGSKGADYPPVKSSIAEGDIVLLDGTKTKLSEYKGKVVIVNLWGIWCGPCRDEMPHLQAMYKKYADDGFVVLGLNIGEQDSKPEPVENIKKFAADMKIDYTLARVDSPMVSQFYQMTKQNVVPQTFLVDRETRLRGVFIGGGPKNYDAIRQSLDKLMNE